MRWILVRCTIDVPVQVPDDSEGYNVHFDIEENHCPGTGVVGTALQNMMMECDDAGVCWACNLNGRNEIIQDPCQGRKASGCPNHRG